MKNLIAMFLSMLLLFAMPGCGEDALAIGGGSAPDAPREENVLPVEPSVSPQEGAESHVSPPLSIPEPSGGVSTESPAPTSEDSATAQEEEPARVVDPDKPMVALTFDDGPHATLTDQLLDILEENGVVATFFQVAQNLPNDPDAVRRAEAMGCEIGNHSYRHANLGKMSAEEIAADLAKADAAFTEVLGHAPTLLRPPYGSMNTAAKTTTGRSLITWSIDTEDWLSRNAEKVIATVQGAGDLNGDVILMHDVHASTIEAAKTLIPWLVEQGYQLVTVTELITLHYGDPVLPNGLYGYSYFTYGKPVILPEGQTVPQPEPPADPPQDTPSTEAPDSGAEPLQPSEDPPSSAPEVEPEEPEVPTQSGGPTPSGSDGTPQPPTGHLERV